VSLLVTLGRYILGKGHWGNTEKAWGLGRRGMEPWWAARGILVFALSERWGAFGGSGRSALVKAFSMGLTPGPTVLDVSLE
jgi:hypothetical protein